LLLCASIRFDAKDGHAASVSRPANTNRKPMAKDPATISPHSAMVNGFRSLNPLLLKAAEIGTFDGPYSEERYRSSL